MNALCLLVYLSTVGCSGMTGGDAAVMASVSAAKPYCELRGVPVRDCAPKAKRFEAAARMIPAEHWALVREVTLLTEGTGKHWGNGKIGVRYKPQKSARVRILLHEAGHIVGDAYLNEPERPSLVDRYCAVTAQLGPEPSDYAEKDCRESFADSYRNYLMGHLRGESEKRWQWMRDNVFVGTTVKASR